MTLDVILGDVWICSGQSNMVIRMDQIENGFEEIQNSRNYTNIRMFQLGLFTSDKEEEDILGGWDNWYSANATDKLAEFSAVCFLTARYLTDLMGDNQRVSGTLFFIFILSTQYLVQLSFLNKHNAGFWPDSNCMEWNPSGILVESRSFGWLCRSTI